MNKEQKFAKVALQFYERSKTIFSNKYNSEEGGSPYRGSNYSGLCKSLRTTRIEEDRRRIKMADYSRLNNEIWDGVYAAGGGMFFPSNKKRLAFIDSKIRKYKRVLNKKKVSK